MYPPVATKDPVAVQVEVQSAYQSIYPDADPAFVPLAFGWAQECFTGGFGGYQPIDAPYHDFEHTLQGTLCLVRLLRGRQSAGAKPKIDRRTFELALLAILLHDTGYLKAGDDVGGTGAKYTVTHVDRSVKFAGAFLAEKDFGAKEIKTVQNMIRCTGLDAAMSVISFQSEQEKVAGYALGTADLLGQMAADDYVEKLPVLYSEFAEAAKFSRDKTHFVTMFSSADDLMQKTPDFWHRFVQVKLDRDFGGLHKFLNDPYPKGKNGYIQRIEANMERLRKRVESASR